MNSQEPVRSKFGQYLHNMRLRAGLTQKQISKKLGYQTPQFISNWERGVSCPPLAIVNQLVKHYKISKDEMFEIYLEDTLGKTVEQVTREFYNAA